MATAISGKVFLVTGAASGMGFATSKAVLAQGAFVAMCDVDESALQQAMQELGGKSLGNSILVGKVDVTRRTEIKSFLEQTKTSFGRIDGVANFAGTGGHLLGKEPIWETSDEECNFILDLNVKGTFHMLGECLKPGVMSENGSFVHIGSMYSLQGFRNGAVFAGSKHAALGMVRSAAKEASERVRVNCVLPGPIDTPMLRANEKRGGGYVSPTTPIPRLGTAEEVASVTVFLLSSASTYVTGAAWSVDGGANS